MVLKFCKDNKFNKGKDAFIVDTVTMGRSSRRRNVQSKGIQKDNLGLRHGQSMRSEWTARSEQVDPEVVPPQNNNEVM